MFTLDVNVPEIKAAMFAHGKGVVADTDIWHKRIGHINLQRLKMMQSKGVVTGLPTFRVDGMQKICEACQFGKQARGAFPHDRNVSRNILDVFIQMFGDLQRQRPWEVAGTMSRLLMITLEKCGSTL